MKYIVSFFLFTTLLLSKVSAQFFRAGLIAGPTITDINGSNLNNNTNSFHKLGFSAGGLVNAKISQRSFVQMELAFIEKGTLQPPDSTMNNDFYTISLNYIDVSFVFKHNLKFSVRKMQITNLGVETGATLGTIVYSNYTFKNSLSQPVSDLNKIDLSLLVGIYYDINSNLFLNFRYSNSIIHALKHSNSFINIYPYFTLNKGNNMVFQITLGYVFNTGKSTEK